MGQGSLAPRFHVPAPRRAGAALGVLLAHVAGLIALLNLPGIRPEVSLGDAIQVLQVAPPASAPAPEPPQVSAVEAPVLVAVAPDPTPLAIPVFAPPASAPAPEPAVVVHAAPARERTDLPPTIESVSYVREPVVRYPPLSRRMKEQGLVVVRVLIGADGRAAEVSVQRSSGYDRLDAAACEAVRRAEFRPYVVGGRAIAATALVPIEFSLAS